MDTESSLEWVIIIIIYTTGRVSVLDKRQLGLG